MLDRITVVLSSLCLLDPDLPIVVGVSGGPDSLCLLHLLHRTRQPVVVAHLNHKLRPDAGEDAQLVQQICETLHKEFVLCEEDVREVALAQKVSIEEAARLSRYRFLFEVAAQRNAQAVAVAHNAEDQVETFLMHLLRGSGLAGLRGMAYRSLPNPWSDTIALVRPMLGFWRSEIDEYLKQRSLSPAEDITNLDVTFARNRIRHGLVPYLESYNPEAKKAIWRTTNMLAGDYAVLEQVIHDACNRCICRELPEAIAVDRGCLLELDRPTARYVLRRAIAHLRPGLLDINFEDIERILLFLENPPRSGESDVAAGLKLFLEGNLCWFAYSIAALPTGDWPQLQAGETFELPAPGRVPLLDGWEIESVIQLPEPDVIANRNPYEAWLDPRHIILPLTVRRRRPGDRFRPMGMEGSSLKLSDLMINERVPRRARRDWPLVCCGDEIVWIPGVRQGMTGQIEPDTREAVHLRTYRSAPGE